jgi:two-component system LytT family response regulator
MGRVTGGAGTDLPAPLRVVVADDEPLIREGLRDILDSEPGVTVVATCADGPAALDAVRAHAPDVLFLDVRMPGADGLEVARALADAGHTPAPPAIVFATAHDEYALAAFEVSAADYLLKPFDAARVRATLRRVRERVGRAPPDGGTELRAQLAALLARIDAGGAASATTGGRWAERLVVGLARGARVVPVASVEWVEAADNYVTVHAADGAGLLRESLHSLQARLDPARFARVHRSALVNLARVHELRPLPSGDYVLTMRSGATVRLSRTHRDDVLRRLG